MLIMMIVVMVILMRIAVVHIVCVRHMVHVVHPLSHTELARALTLRVGRHLHDDVTTGHLGLHVRMSHGGQIRLDPLGKLITEFLVGHLATTELELDAHLVPIKQEVFRMNDLDEVVMRINANTELHLLQLGRFLMLVSLLFVLLLDVLVLPVVDDFAHRRIHIPSHFYQVQATLLGYPYRLGSRQDTKLLT